MLEAFKISSDSAIANGVANFSSSIPASTSIPVALTGMSSTKAISDCAMPKGVTNLASSVPVFMSKNVAFGGVAVISASLRAFGVMYLASSEPSTTSDDVAFAGTVGMSVVKAILESLIALGVANFASSVPSFISSPEHLTASELPPCARSCQYSSQSSPTPGSVLEADICSCKAKYELAGSPLLTTSFSSYSVAVSHPPAPVKDPGSPFCAINCQYVVSVGVFPVVS